MIQLLQRKSLRFFHPILKRITNIYLSKPRDYRYKGIALTVVPGVFHPGLFYSTKVLLNFAETLDLQHKTVLELGAGSGLISLSLAKMGVNIVASDISKTALNALQQNALKNNVHLELIESNLFDEIDPSRFDIVLINPPYYPKTPISVEEQSWYCGRNFEYFESLFEQLRSVKSIVLYMILSEDCDLDRILSIAEKNLLTNELVFQTSVGGEKNFIYRLAMN